MVWPVLRHLPSLEREIERASGRRRIRVSSLLTGTATRVDSELARTVIAVHAAHQDRSTKERLTEPTQWAGERISLAGTPDGVGLLM